jgi:hypothetical protein
LDISSYLIKFGKTGIRAFSQAKAKLPPVGMKMDEAHRNITTGSNGEH